MVFNKNCATHNKKKIQNELFFMDGQSEACPSSRIISRKSSVQYPYGNHHMSVKEIHPGIFRIRLPLPGKKPGPVNAYLFKGENISLIDTGTPLSIKQLKQGLVQIGVRFQDIDKIILTHGHIDHFSGTRLILRTKKAKARVFAHKADVQEIETGADASLIAYHRFLFRAGIPLMIRLLMIVMFRWYQFLSLTCNVDNYIKNNDIIKLGDYEGRIIETPGHTKGSVCIHLETENILFSGDHILSHITPIALPMIDHLNWLPARKSQDEFYQSLQSIEKINPQEIFPAHGPSVTDFNETFAMYKDCFKKRQNDLMTLIETTENRTLYQTALKLFPNLNRKRILLEIFLAISEVYTHIQVLEKKGKVSTTIKNGKLMASQKAPFT